MSNTYVKGPNSYIYGAKRVANNVVDSKFQGEKSHHIFGMSRTN